MAKSDSSNKIMTDTEAWESIDWTKVEVRVRKLQERIYKASRCGDIRKVRKLQKTLIRSFSNRLLAVRRVTQDNRGKKTAGVDGVKSLNPKQRLKLASLLRLTGKAKPARRVWIPKPGKKELRPLGIPVMFDRALQGLVKNAIEPEWEADFEEESYGFRPGRSCHDAIKDIWDNLRYKSKYVLDADIAKCFAQINQEALLNKLKLKGKMRKQIKAWLKSGCIDKNVFEETQKGTPQGGVISPLLANIALHGIVSTIREKYPIDGKGYVIGNISRKYGFKAQTLRISFVRYADDFVIICDSKEVILDCKAIVIEFLKAIGLELKDEKTRLCHTFLPQESEDGKAGFDFLGYHIRQYPISKYKAGSNPKGKRLEFQTLITPSKKKLQAHQDKLHNIILKTHAKVPQETLIYKLNPIIRGWSNYYSVSDAKTTEHMSEQDSLTWKKLQKWAKKRTRKTGDWKQYFKTIKGRKWVFANEKETYKLINHTDTSCSVKDYRKVDGDVSPYDGNWAYWSGRMGYYPGIRTEVATLMKKQKGKCSHCGLHFHVDDVIEVDHIKPTSLGGKNTRENKQLLHAHCHDEKTRTDGSLDKEMVAKYQAQAKYNDKSRTKAKEKVKKSHDRGGYVE